MKRAFVFHIIMKNVHLQQYIYYKILSVNCMHAIKPRNENHNAKTMHTRVRDLENQRVKFQCVSDMTSAVV